MSGFNQLVKQAVPRWVSIDTAIQAAYNEFAQRHCPCVILAHSQGGNFAFNMALAHPDKIKAVVAVEPSGFPDPAKTDLSRLKGMPHLFVWGNCIAATPLWTRVKAGPEHYRTALNQQGVKADAIDLPALGIRGNSDMMMMDRNANDNAALGAAMAGRTGADEAVSGWLAEDRSFQWPFFAATGWPDPLVETASGSA